MGLQAVLAAAANVSLGAEQQLICFPCQILSGAAFSGRSQDRLDLSKGLSIRRCSLQKDQAVVQMDEMTQQNAALVEQAAASLHEQTRHLKAAVSVFKIPDEGRMERF